MVCYVHFLSLGASPMCYLIYVLSPMLYVHFLILAVCSSHLLPQSAVLPSFNVLDVLRSHVLRDGDDAYGNGRRTDRFLARHP